jgi:membrane protein YqaA with SNARE-associated domain
MKTKVRTLLIIPINGLVFWCDLFRFLSSAFRLTAKKILLHCTLNRVIRYLMKRRQIGDEVRENGRNSRH